MLVFLFTFTFYVYHRALSLIQKYCLGIAKTRKSQNEIEAFVFSNQEEQSFNQTSSNKYLIENSHKKLQLNLQIKYLSINRYPRYPMK